MKWHKKTDIAFFVKKIENRRVKMSESAVKRAISSSVAVDEERFQAARGPVMIRGAIKWELFAGEATGEAIVRGRAIFLCYCRRFYGKIRRRRGARALTAQHRGSVAENGLFERY
ncbi:MAG: hypothetical protein IJM24_05780 [Clostridia bacterium]|nr:hypothetical protein [Clostridia bacterium]